MLDNTFSLFTYLEILRQHLNMIFHIKQIISRSFDISVMKYFKFFKRS